MRKILFLLPVAFLLIVPQAHAVITWEESLGNVLFDCTDGGFLMILEGNGRGEMTISNPRTFVFIFEENYVLGFERHGNIKWDAASFTSWVYPNLFTRLKLAGTEPGTVKFDGQNRVLVFGIRENMRISGNYSFRTIGTVSSCTP